MEFTLWAIEEDDLSIFGGRRRIAGNFRANTLDKAWEIAGKYSKEENEYFQLEEQRDRGKWYHTEGVPF